jgi:FMN phosphatase YigB (HAD superfamily)
LGGMVLWDFDGTLGHRPGRWSGCVIEALDRHSPGHGATPEDVVPLLSEGFPWHTPEVAHPELRDEGAWWQRLEALLATAFVSLGFEHNAAELAAATHALYVDPSGFEVFDDAWPALERLQSAGWGSAIISNHMPELPGIAAALGLSRYISTIVNSAETGYEKPHPKAFELAVAAVGRPKDVWMVGDNFVADVAGAEAVGIPAVLVRTDDPRARRRAATARDAVEIILDS